MIYFIKCHSFVKIGHAIATDRIEQLQIGCPYKLEALGYLDGDMKDEKKLHKRFSHLRKSRRSEWFRLDEELRNFIAKNTVPPISPHEKERLRLERQLEKWKQHNLSAEEINSRREREGKPALINLASKAKLDELEEKIRRLRLMPMNAKAVSKPNTCSTCLLIASASASGSRETVKAKIPDYTSRN